MQDNKAVYRRYIEEIFNKADFTLLEELLSDDYVYHDAPPGTPKGREGIRQVVEMFHKGFPDMKITFDDQIAEGDKVASRTTFRGTHTGKIFGIPPTGKAVTMRGVTIVSVKNGQITESWVNNDGLGLMKQLAGDRVL